MQYKRLIKRVSDAQVLEICARYDAGEPIDALAAVYGVSSGTIHRYLHDRDIVSELSSAIAAATGADLAVIKKIVSRYSIRAGGKRSVTDRPIKPGRIFGRLSVTAVAESPHTWSCLCTCGNSVLASEQALRSGKLVSCGCFTRHVYQDVSDTLEYRMWAHAKHRSSKLNLPFDLTLDDIYIPDVCPVLGIPLNFGNDRNEHDSPSIDRVIPSKGYTKLNVTVISSRANNIKSDLAADELRAKAAAKIREAGTVGVSAESKADAIDKADKYTRVADYIDARVAAAAPVVISPYARHVAADIAKCRAGGRSIGAASEYSSEAIAAMPPAKAKLAISEAKRAQLLRMAGTRSVIKSISSRANGCLGGRPRKPREAQATQPWIIYHGKLVNTVDKPIEEATLPVKQSKYGRRARRISGYCDSPAAQAIKSELKLLQARESVK